VSGDVGGELISVPHTAGEAAEVARIERDFADEAIITHDGYLAPLDPALSQYEVQLTRSLGHVLLKQAGIICTPDIQRHEIEVGPTGGFALMLCSDGITDELKPRHIAERVESAATAAEACRELCQEAQDFCMDADRVDDCTAVVLRFTNT
jgi:serine/threonine protein phosphatase PrpC